MKHLLYLALIVAAPATAAAQLQSEVYVSGLSSPLELVQDPVASHVHYVVEQHGRIRVVVGGVLQPVDFLDLSSQISAGGERGLLGLALAPDYAASGRFFVNFTNLDGNTVVARFTRSSSDPLRADPGSRFDLRWGGSLRYIEQPFANHNGGHLEFGPDGFLYIAMGDGGSGGDPDNHAQNPQSLLGKILRIDVDVADNHPDGYVTPPGNPFAGTGARPEIWSFGVRNPWKFTFDRSGAGGGGTHAMLMGDVGQNAFEEVNYEPAGAGGRNYGWRLREGFAPFLPDTPPAFLPLIDPILVYGRDEGRSVTGGHVYRGAGLGAAYFGRYFYADFVTGRVWSVALSLDNDGEATASLPFEHTAELGGSGTLGNISAFSADASGELYIVSFNGTVFRLRSAGGAPPPGGSLVRLTIAPPSGGSIFAPGISCGAAGGPCAIDLPPGIPIALEVQPAAGFQFSAWTGEPDCLDGFIVLTTNITCSATFSGGPAPAPPPASGLRRLTVTRPGGGTIFGAGIVCGTLAAECTIDLPAGLTLVLEAVPDPGAAFGAWSGDCPGGVVTLTADRTCAPTFTTSGSSPPPSEPPPPPSSGLRRLTVIRPTGGTIFGAGIVCGVVDAACTIDLPAGLTLVLEAVAEPGASLGGWSAECPDGVVTLTADRTCAPTFTTSGSPPAPPPPTGLVRLTVVRPSGGSVFGAGIVCGDAGDACTIDLPAGIAFGFDIVASPGFEFAGWSGTGCASTVELTVDRLCTPSFVPAVEDRR